MIAARWGKNLLSRRTSQRTPNSFTSQQLIRLRSYVARKDDVYFDNDESTLLRLEKADLGFGIPPVDLTIQKVTHGGHALLGRNGKGKSVLAHAILDEKQFLNGKMPISPKTIQHVSFQSHQSLLEKGGTVYTALAQGNLNKAAQFLVVRFGLYPLLHQDVRTLSNGQIKKVLIVRALSLRPQLLVLDNAFDGLDVPSRDVLKKLVSKTLKGFAPDILVQGVSARNTAHTQVLLLTQRAEEIADEIATISYFEENDRNDVERTTHRTGRLVTVPREGHSAAQALHLSLGVDDEIDQDGSIQNLDYHLPNASIIREWWNADGYNRYESIPEDVLAVDMQDVSVDRNDKLLLQGINWSVQPGQRWICGGLNGAGKSTLSRLLSHHEDAKDVRGHMQVFGMGPEEVGCYPVGWVSTELHMSVAQSDQTARKILLETAKEEDDFVSLQSVSAWLGIQCLVDQPFNKLSQGQQRLMLIAIALASRPRLLVLDEPCQGLDLLNRQKVLELVERICRETNMGLIYITHHLEEMIPSITHALHLKEGKVVFQGPQAEYNPTALED